MPRPPFRTLSLLLATAGPLLFVPPLQAQTNTAAPTNYEGWMARGRQLLNAPGEGATEALKRQDKEVTKPRQAAEAFAKAAPLGRTDEERVVAWNNAALAYRLGGKPQESYDAFLKVLAFKNLSTGDRAKAQLEAAKSFASIDSAKPKAQQNSAAVIAEFNKVSAQGEVAPPVLAQVHKEIASIYARDLKYMDAALENEKAAKIDPKNGDEAIDAALVNMTYLPPTPENTAMLDRLYKLRTTVGKAATPAQTGDKTNWKRTYTKRWAEAMAKHGAHARVAEIWTELSNDTSQTMLERFDNLEKLAAYQMGRKDFAGVLTTYDRALKLPGIGFPQQRIAAYGKAQAHTFNRDLPKAIEAIVPLTKHRDAQPDDKALAMADIGSLYQQQEKAARQANAAPEVLASFDKQAVDSFESGLSVSGISPAAKLNLLTRRVQVEMNNGQWPAAHAQVQRGFEMFKGGPAGIAKELHKLNARVYRAEKKYPEAMAALTEAARKEGAPANIYAPDQGTTQQAIAMYVETLGAKDFATARKIYETLHNWGLNPVESTLMLARIEVESGNFAAAKPHLQKLATAPLVGNYKAMYEALKSKMPADPKPTG